MLHEIGSRVLLAPIEETLATLRAELEEKYERVNRRIENGENKHIKITGAGDKRRWSLVYPTEEDGVLYRAAKVSGIGRNRATVENSGGFAVGQATENDGLPSEH